MSIERVIKSLVNLGLSRADAEVYFQLATTGPATAKTIISNLTVNKRQIYRSLKTLQQKGITSGDQEYPTKFSAISFDKVLDLLLEVKKEQAKSLEASKAELVADFQTEKKKSKETN